MALRDQPYLPLYVQDFLTDEKLMECSASATGIYIRLICIMHKSDEYGTILLKQKDKQTSNQINNFALKLVKHLPYGETEIRDGIFELIEYEVLRIDGNKLIQKRMVRDNEISIIRASAGKKGGLSTQFALAKKEAKGAANTEDESKIVIDYEFIVENYHFLCPKMNKVEVINDQRKGYMNSRVGEYGIDKVISVLRLTGESDFLNGKNERAWKADFEWIIRPTNFIKIMEGKYNNQHIEAKVYTHAEMLKLSEKNPDIWKQYNAVKRDGERKAVFILKS